MLLPRRADSVNYFLLGSAAIICIFHLAVIDVAGGREESGRGGAHFVSQQLWDEKKKMDSLTARAQRSVHFGCFSVISVIIGDN